MDSPTRKALITCLSLRAIYTFHGVLHQMLDAGLSRSTDYTDRYILLRDWGRIGFYGFVRMWRFRLVAPRYRSRCRGTGQVPIYFIPVRAFSSFVAWWRRRIPPRTAGRVDALTIRNMFACKVYVQCLEFAFVSISNNVPIDESVTCCDLNVGMCWPENNVPCVILINSPWSHVFQ